MTCASCGSALIPGARFCGHCGTAVDSQPCRSCGIPNPINNRFCGSCGANSAGGAPGEPDRNIALGSSGERRLATVLFADLVGFTSLSEQLDAETVARTADEALRRMAEIIEGHGGTVDKYLGDGLMAVFGVPSAHDDDAERAVASAIALCAEQGRLSISCGVNTGEVMVMAVGGGERTVIGDAVNVAARLEKVAAPGEVLIGKLTAELVGPRVQLVERTPVELKGKADAVEVWQAVSVDSRSLSNAATQVPLVGRDRERSLLTARWERCLATRTPSYAVLTGEAGIGKSRLVTEVVERASVGANVVTTAYPAYGTLGVAVVVEALYRVLGPCGDHDVDLRVRALAGDLDPSLRGMDPAAVEREGHWGLRRYLSLQAVEKPLLLVVDDAHNGGRALFNLVTDVVSRVEDVAVFVILSGRSDSTAWLTGVPPNALVRLGALPAEESVMLARLYAGNEKPLAVEALGTVVERARGNPLHLRELVRMAASDRTNGGIDLAMPMSLKSVLQARLDTLPAGERLALQHLAVLGGNATAAQVEALGLSGLDEELEALVVADLVRREDDTYNVADRLLAEVAYDTLPLSVRGERHRAAASSTKSRTERARHLDLAVRHLDEEPQLRDAAAAANAEAGVELLATHRLSEGVRYLVRAVDLGYRHAPDLLRLARGLLEMSRGAEALEVLGLLDENEMPDQWQEAERLNLAAEAVAHVSPLQAIGELESAAVRWARLGDPAREARARSQKALQYTLLGQFDNAVDEAERALVVFAQTNDRAGEVDARRTIALLHPERPEVSGWLREGLAMAEDRGDRASQLVWLASMAFEGYTRHRLGTTELCQPTIDIAVRLATLSDEMGATESAVQGWSVAAALSRLSGNVPAARTYAIRASALHVDPMSGLWYFRDACRMMMELMNDRVQPTLVAFDDQPDPLVLLAVVHSADVLMAAGRIDDALEALSHPPTIVVTGRAGAQARALITLSHAQTLVLGGRYGECTALLSPSYEALQQCGVDLRARVASAVLAEALAHGGERRAARELLERSAERPGEVSIAEAFRARAWVRADPGSLERFSWLEELSRRLSAPGLLLGLESSTSEPLPTS